MTKNNDVFLQAKKTAVKFLMYKKRTEFEVLTMLVQKEYNKDIAVEVVKYLKQIEYIDDKTYAEKYIKDAINIKKHGKQRIYSDLLIRGIDKGIILDTLNNLNFDEIEYLEPMVKRKLEKTKAVDKNALDKVKRYFYRRGFSLDSIDYCINECNNIKK